MRWIVVEYRLLLKLGYAAAAVVHARDQMHAGNDPAAHLKTLGCRLLLLMNLVVNE